MKENSHWKTPVTQIQAKIYIYIYIYIYKGNSINWLNIA